VFIRKRSTKDIWENLYEFVLKENDGPLPLHEPSSLQALVTDVLGNEDFKIQQVSAEYRQQLTHQTITGQFIRATIFSPSKYLNGYKTAGVNDLHRYPFPKFITTFLLEKSIV
jgi:A/G-specific adenine glycosylase